METSIAKHLLGDMDPLEIQPDVIFVGHADPAMHLDGLLGRQLGDLTGLGLGQRTGHAGIVEIRIKILE
nr:hypothetical protein [Sphingopyxis sp. BSNA05]